LQSDTPQPIEEAHAEAIVLNNSIEAVKADSNPNTIHGSEAIAQVTREASGTEEAYKAEMAKKIEAFEVEWKQEHEALKAKEAENERKLVEFLASLIENPIKSGSVDVASSNVAAEVAPTTIPVPAEAQAALDATIPTVAVEPLVTPAPELTPQAPVASIPPLL
jgi:hypothetical protein